MALFVLRQRTLNNLREDNGSLRKQIDLEKSARAARFVELPANTVAKLSTADERELLQLRSKIGPLRDQLRDISNRVVLLKGHGYDIRKPLDSPLGGDIKR
jgi:hypothetical protein